MKKLLILSLLVFAGVSQARDVESYEVSGDLNPATNSEAQICQSLAEKALKSYQAYATDDRITKWKACECRVNPPIPGVAAGGRACRLGYVYSTDLPKGDGKQVTKNLVIPKF